ncbi:MULTISPECIES: DUF5131 family protein [unclassified Helicobacter]|uniref:DUF5131 family protein n=1 Tax=unclassified Helicobacter TaxID=2593540 RepID=UPI001F3A88C6|nr:MULTISPECIES: DUF5131 family protein [unclassified Helicobacter]
MHQTPPMHRLDSSDMDSHKAESSFLDSDISSASSSAHNASATKNTNATKNPSLAKSRTTIESTLFTFDKDCLISTQNNTSSASNFASNSARHALKHASGSVSSNALLMADSASARESTLESTHTLDSAFAPNSAPAPEFSYNPWHGCTRISEGCQNCFIYTIDSIHGKDASILRRNKNFALPIARTRQGGYKIPSGAIIWLCFSSDFLLKGADMWRDEVWAMIRERRDCTFIFFTKRIARLESCLPSDWGEGYENVIIGCSVENQKRADERLSVFLRLPIKRRYIIAAPLIAPLDLRAYLGGGVELVSVGGESGRDARACRYEWVLDIREQCREAGVAFHFHQLGARFVKDGKLYKIPKHLSRQQAQKAGINLARNSRDILV